MIEDPGVADGVRAQSGSRRPYWIGRMVALHHFLIDDAAYR
jgi:hypothetical protein